MEPFFSAFSVQGWVDSAVRIFNHDALSVAVMRYAIFCAVMAFLVCRRGKYYGG